MILFRTILSFVIALLNCHNNATVFSQKIHNMTMLSLIGMTGNAPRDGRACRSAQRMVAQSINQRQDFLPDYNIVLDFQDEGPASMLAARGAVNFNRRKGMSSSSFQASIILGPTFTPGCKSLGSWMAQHLGYFILASACLGPMYTNQRKIYPNLYRTRISTEFNNYGLIPFFKQNNWTKVALFANGDNSYNIQLAMHFQESVRRTGISVIWFEVASGITRPVVDSMKESGARIFMLEMVDLPTYLNFLCLTHNAGMRGSKYVFNLPFALYIDPANLPHLIGIDQCSKPAITQHIRQSVLILGTTAAALGNNGPVTVFQYDREGFETRLVNFTNGERAPDYDDRHTCHDRILQALLALDKADKRLKTISNGSVSLKDVDAPLQTAFVMQQVKLAMDETDFSGLRVGRVKYSQRLELENEPMFIASWKNSSNPAHFAILRTMETLPATDPKSYSLKELLPIDWGGRVPKDAATSVEIYVETEDTAKWLLTSFGIVSSACQAFLMCYLVKLKSQTRLSIAEWCQYLIISCACLTLSLAGVTFAQGSGGQPELCNIPRICAVVGFASLTGVMSGKFYIMQKSHKTAAINGTIMRTFSARRQRLGMRYPLQRSNTVTETTTNATTFHHQINSVSSSTLLKSGAKSDLQVIVYWLAFFLMNVAIALPTAAQMDILVLPRNNGGSGNIIYNEEADSYSIYLVKACWSPNEAQLQGAILGLNALALIVTVFWCYNLKRYIEQTAANVAVTAYALISANNLSLLIAGVCIYSVIGDEPVSQQIVLSVLSLIISLCSSSIFYYWTIFK